MRSAAAPLTSRYLYPHADLDTLSEKCGPSLNGDSKLNKRNANTARLLVWELPTLQAGQPFCFLNCTDIHGLRD